MKLSRKISIVAVVLIVTMVFFGVFAMNILKNNLIDSRKHEIQSILTFTVNQARHFVELEKANKITREEAEKNVIRIFSEMREGNYFLWANDANGIARVHIKDSVIGVFQSSYAKYIGYLEQNPFMFIVGESEKANSNTLYVKVNGMTLLPEWNWILGIGVYVDELEAEVHQFAMSLIFAALIMFVVIFGAVFWVYRSVINQLGDDPLTVIELVTRAEHEGFHSTTDESYSKTSLLYLMSNFYQHIHSVLDSLRHQNQSISKNSVELVSSAKRFEGLIDAASLKGKRVGDNLTENKKQIQQTHSGLASSGQYLEVVASRVTDSIIINTNNEKEIQKIEASIASDANELVKLSQNLRRFDTLIGAFNDFYDQYQSSDNGAVETSLDISIENTPPAFFVKHTEAVAQAKAVLSELDAGVEALKGSIKQSERGLAQYLNYFGEQRLSLVSLGENLASVQLHIEQVVQAQTCLLDEMPNGLDQHFDVILSSLVIITESIDEYKTTSDKMSHDLDSIYF